ncbi:uncharacterized protein UBRO_03722 [Ustilago bromivora]|uniref:RlpA-like protein double-psi beta-barrel domain-containing protein n=1 Tax=Ustilago bromivora TaxID=307758 RepID=A0A1K0FVZ6_9BASI|nr:uncharacterized protein UBRO_03722 [Ustilago bromivora]SYW85275.1 uncharacterized protein UBRO2_05748 [Ustilago bromivora]
MICAKTILLAFVAISISLMTVTQATQPTISPNAAVRRHAWMMENRPMRRSIAVAQGKMVPQRRQTAEQIAQAVALKQWDDDFHAKNAEWQQAAVAALEKGQTPPTLDEYWQGKSDSSSSSSADSCSSSSSDSPAPAQQEQTQQPQRQEEQKQQPQQQEEQKQSTNNNDSNNDDAWSQDSSEDCSDQEEEAPASPTTGEASSSAKGVAAAAVTGSKNQATNGTGGNNNNSKNNNSSSSSSSSQATLGHYSGQATYYAPGLGACGWTNGEADYIVAISASLFDSFGSGNPNKNPACGHKIAATYGGKTITVSVADRCVGCAWGDLDFTSTGFSQLADMSQGRLDGLSWSWIGGAP